MRIDARFGMPDGVGAAGEASLRYAGGLRALLEAEGVGCFVRVLLPLSLTGGTSLVVGTWLRVGEADFGAAQRSWESFGYEGMVLAGTLANAVPPFEDELLHAPVTVGVRDRDELPYVTGSERPGVACVLATVWDRDHVLSHCREPLPVAVRTRVGARWSIERSAGLAAEAGDGPTRRFAGHGRSVAATPLASPDVPSGHWTTERSPGRVRHTRWTPVVRGGRERYEFHGHDAVPGAALAVVCTVDDRADLAWAGHVWESVRVESVRVEDGADGAEPGS
nr:DUF2199 domain-containing protein [Streptomyces sp. NBC_00899]